MTIKCSLVSIYESTANASVLALTGAKEDLTQHTLWKQQKGNSALMYCLRCTVLSVPPPPKVSFPLFYFRLRTVVFRLSRTGDIKAVTFVLVGQER